jgi:hypothetical protein
MVPAKQVSNYGMRAAGGIAGSIVVGFVNAILGGTVFALSSSMGFWPSLVVGAVMAVGGLRILGKGKSKAGGIALLGAGIMTGLSFIVQPLLWLAPAVLLGYGVCNGYKFFTGVKSRS